MLPRSLSCFERDLSAPTFALCGWVSILYLWDGQRWQVSYLAIWAYERGKPEGHPQAPQDPRLHRSEPPRSLRKRLAVSPFQRRRRLRTTTSQQRLHWLRAPNNTCLSRPDPPTLRLRRVGDPGHRPARQDGAGTAGDGRGTAERDRKSAAASGGSPEAPAGRSTQRSGPAQPSQGRFGAAPPVWPTCGQPAPSQMRVGGRGAGGLGADWAAGAVGSRAGCAAGRPLCAREGKRGRAGGR